jgi:hypothetical protein
VTTKSEILLHPVRLRIVLAMGAESLTTGQLAESLPDVAPATLYRQVAVLVGASMLEIVSERRSRGGTERTYALVSDTVRLAPDETVAMSRDEHMRGFITFVGSLVEAFGRYLDDSESDLASDAVGYRQAGLWLSETERQVLFAELADALSPHVGNEPTPERRRILLNTILIPDAAMAPAANTKDRRDPS